LTVLLVAIHILVSLFLIFIVLVQGGKGAELGAAFGGGSSQTLFGGRGAATFLNKATTIVAVVFMLTSLLLAIVSVRGTTVIKSTTPATAPVQEEPFRTMPPIGPQAPAGQAPPAGPQAPAQQAPPAGQAPAK
jgi:preprotein translocase subunit SecG